MDSLDSTFFERVLRLKRIRPNHYLDINRNFKEMWENNGGLTSTRTKYIWAFSLLRSDFSRHRKLGSKIIEQFHDQEELDPAHRYMQFQLALTRIRMESYASAMDTMKLSRTFYPGYGRNVALEKYLHYKLQDNIWLDFCEVAFQLFFAGSAIYFGCKICELDFQWEWENEGPPMVAYVYSGEPL